MDGVKKILFLVLHRKDRSPGQRYRHEQYISYLEANGFQCDFSPLLTAEEDKVFYSAGNYLRKMLIGLKALRRRWKDIRRAKSFDALYIYRDAFFFGTFIERWLKKSGVPIIYDFDDAIWLMDENPNQGLFNKLKNPKKVPKIIELADRVVVGNPYLRDYAMQFNERVEIIPSTIDMLEYQQKMSIQKGICIGWTGSFSTIKHFEQAVPALMEIKRQFGDKVYFKLIGDDSYTNEALDIRGLKWQAATEVEDLSEINIGIMPLPDNQWTQGKCGMKGLQYMALGIPTIMSPVGVNSDIIQDGENGFLASTTEEWVEKLSRLIVDGELRRKLGSAGKQTVEERYSVAANKEKWLQVFS